ncbi:MAG: S41 family peptidase [Thermodesulfobacteriota bacterium]
MPRPHRPSESTPPKRTEPRNRRIVRTLLAWCVVLGFGAGLAACFPAWSRADERGTILQGHARTVRKPDHRLKLLDDAMTVIRSNYVEAISDPEAVKAALDKVSEQLPTPCDHHAELPEKGCDDPDQCLRDALLTISSRCGLEPDVLVRKFLRALLQNLDANSDLLDATMLQEIEIATSGRFGGLGMVVAFRDGEYVVVSSFEGTPARKAGLQPGDTILEINGLAIAGLPLPQVLRLVRGRAGSRILLTLKERKTGRIRELHMVRRVINMPPVRSAMLRDGTAYLRIVNFQQSTSREVMTTFRKLTKGHRTSLKGLVVDLRDNPGGLFDQALKVAAVLMDSGMITSVRGRLGRLNRDFSVQPGGHGIECPIVVLMNRGTASAAEILAGALKGRPNVTLMGDRSFGKASVQGIFPLGRGLALRLTTAHYLTADGSDIDKKGIEPDITLPEASVPSGYDNQEEMGPDGVERDPCVRRALASLTETACINRCVFSSLY